MSLRSATRIAARSVRSAAAPRAPVIARRAASSGGHAKPGSDLPWAIGSAVFFIPTGAYLWWGGSKNEHGENLHENHPHDQHHGKVAKDQHGREGIETLYKAPEDGVEHSEKGTEREDGGDDDTETKQDDDDEGVSKEDVKDSVKQAMAANAPKVAQSDQPGTESEDSGVEIQGEDKSDSKGEDKSEGDEPSQKDIKASLERAEKTAVPRAAMDEEEKGHGNQADLDKDE